MFIDDDNEYSKEMLSMSLKLNDVISNVNITPISFIKIKLDFFVGKTSSDITNMDVYDSLNVDIITISKTTKT